MMTGLTTADSSLVSEPDVRTVETAYSTEDLNLIDLLEWTTEISNFTMALSPEDMFMFFAIPVFCSFGVVGNGIVLWILGFKIKRNKFTVYILNLAISDFLFLLCRLLSLLLFGLEFVIETVYVSSNIFEILFVLYIFGYNNNQYLLTAISAERCLSTFYPIWYHCWRPKHLSSILCAVLWALAFMVTGLEYFICMGNLTVSENVEMKLRSCQAVSLFTCILTFLIFTPIMLTCSLALLIQIQMRSQRHQPPKLYIIITVTVFLFLICSIPLRVILFLLNYYDISPSRIISICFTVLSTVSSCTNPFIYFYIGNCSGRRTTGSLKTVLQEAFKDENPEITEDCKISMERET